MRWNVYLAGIAVAVNFTRVGKFLRLNELSYRDQFNQGHGFD